MKVILSLLIIISFLLSQTDKMYIGENSTTSTTVDKKVKTVEKLPFSNTYVIYGKYNGVDWETGAINFLGNDGKLYSDPTYVQAIRNSKNQFHLAPNVMTSLKFKKQETALANLKAQCEENSTVKVMILPFRDDFYGLTEDVENTMAVEACYNVIPNEKGLEYIFNNNLALENLNDFTLKNIGKSLDVDYIIYGYASEYDVPYKYSSVSSDQSIQRVSYYDSNNWMSDLLISLNNWAVVGSEMKMRSDASLAAGAYITLTYYSINIDNGEKKFLIQNKTVLKKG